MEQEPLWNLLQWSSIMAVDREIRVTFDSVVTEDEYARIIREIMSIVNTNTKSTTTAAYSAGGTSNIKVDVTV